MNGWQVLKHMCVHILCSVSQRSLSSVNIWRKHKLRHKHLEIVLSSVHTEYHFNVVDIKRVFHFGFLFPLTLLLPSEATVTGTYNLVIARNLRNKLKFSSSMLQPIFPKPDLIGVFDPVAYDCLDKCNTLTLHTSLTLENSLANQPNSQPASLNCLNQSEPI